MLVPFIASTTTHQRDNARWLAHHQAAIHLPQSELSVEGLAALLKKMTRETCWKMAEAAYANGRRDANEAIANVLEKLVGSAGLA